MDIDMRALEHLDKDRLFREFAIAISELNAEEQRIWFSMLPEDERSLFQIWVVERAVTQFGDTIRALVQAVTDALQPVFEALTALAKEIYQALENVVTDLRRENLYWRLRHKRLPHQMATWLSGRWPRRWLPQLRPMAP